MPATNELQGRFLPERTRTRALARAFLYSLRYIWEWGTYTCDVPFFLTLIARDISCDHHDARFGLQWRNRCLRCVDYKLSESFYCSEGIGRVRER